MKRAFVFCVVALVAVSVAQPAMATKEFSEHWSKKYVEPSKNEEFKKLVAEAKCNVCHQGEKKSERNPYGVELKNLGLDKKTFSPPKIKEDPEKARKAIEEIFKKAEDLKAKDSEETFGKRISEGKLPYSK